MWSPWGQVSARRAGESFHDSCTSAQTVSGGCKPSPFQTGSKMWQPMSPDQPVPKSCQARHLVGW